LRHRLAKLTVLALLSITAIVVIVGAAFFWRLSQGPVSLDFMTRRIEGEINKSLNGMTVKMGGAVFELDNKTHVPHFRLRDMVLLDQSGGLIAKSNRAAISFDGAALFTGSMVPKGLELIGSRILVKRRLDGSISLGFGSQPAAENAAVTLGAQAENDPGSKADRGGNPAPASETSSSALIDILSGAGSGSAASLEDIRVTEASIQLFDEANQSNWFAPEADLTFKRMPYGFAVFAKAAVASGPTQWRADVSANYRKEAHSFAISARIEDLIPANVADKIFALSQFARVNVPLAGHAEIEVTDQGVVTKASAEFAASAGVVNLPEYIAQPIVIDEGALRMDYDVATGGFNIVDSIILIGGSRAELTGKVEPVREVDGKLTDIKIDIKATNVSVDTLGTVKNPVLVDKVEFLGKAAVEGAELDIEDLIVMSGNTGVRLRGEVTGGDQSAGISLDGNVRDISADFLKKLWPPIVAPKSRKWVSENIVTGRISDGVFHVKIPVNGLAAALAQKFMPNENIDFQFSLKDVDSNYFKTLPTLTQASGTAHLQGDNFVLNIDQGNIVLPSQGSVQVSNTVFTATKLLLDEVPGTFSINLSASAANMVELAGQPSLDLMAKAGFSIPNLTGQATANIELALPLVKDVPRARVTSTAAVKIVHGAVKGVAPNVDLSDAAISMTFDRKGITAAGPLKINGFPATLSWARPAAIGSKATATLATEIDDQGREKLGFKLGSYFQGPMKLTADISGVGEKNPTVQVNADLAKVEMTVNAFNFYRPPTDGTTASFTYSSSPEEGRKVEDLVVEGPGLAVNGNIFLNANGSLKSAVFSQVSLNDDNNFSMKMTPSAGGQSIELNGKSFDARPFVKSIFSKSSAPGGEPDAAPQSLDVIAQVDRIIAHRGEVLTNVSANISVKRSFLATADIEGKFLSGGTLAIRVTPAGDGRTLEVNSGDGGAALRAANLYSKVAGGELVFTAQMANDGGSTIRRGNLTLRDFAVRNEGALASVDSRGKAKKSGPRRDGMNFTRLKLPFTADAKFIRIGSTLLKGTDLGASAEGIIRKSDGAIDITGTIIPAYGLNSALSNIPLVGDILTGGKGQGIFGLTYAMSGTFAAPKFQVNPVSAIAPGILRKFFEFDGSGQPYKPRKQDTQH
jgi:Protein of unknown function/AsmA-like C-terminal region